MIRKICTSLLLFLMSIGGFFVNIEHQGSLTFGGISLGSQVARAAETTQDSEKDQVKKMYTSIVAGINILLGVLTFFVSPAIMLAGWLMSPDWTSGDLFNIRGSMHMLWVTVSNILYFIYAILLIVIALATMFNQQKFSYQSMLPRLALGIILVPFTWWFVQWTISLASIVTASVVTIPQDTLKVQKSAWWDEKRVIPKNVTFDSNTNPTGEKPSETKASDYIQRSECPDECLTPKQFFEKAGGEWAPLMVYAYGVFKIQDLSKLSTEFNGVNAIADLVNRGLIGAIMFILYGILVMALIFVLLIRAIKLWFYAIFSPLFTLHFVMGKEVLGDKMNDFGIKEFLGLAFIPAIIGLTLSFGLVIISAIHAPITKESRTDVNKLTLFGNTNNYIESTIKDKKTAETKIVIGDTSYTYLGPAKNDTTATTVMSALNAGGNFFGTIIIDIIALVFIWASFMAAKGVSKAVDVAIKPFEEMGNKIGGFAKELPKYTPLPLPGGSFAGMDKAIQKVNNNLYESAMKRYDESDTARLLGGSGSSEVLKLREALTNNASGIQDAAKSMTQSRFHHDGLQEIKKLDTEKIMDMIRRNGQYGSHEIHEIEMLVKKLKDPKEKFSEDDSHKLQGLLGGGIKSGNLHEADKVTKMYGKGGAEQPAPESSGGSGIITKKVDGTTNNAVAINIGGSKVEISVNNDDVADANNSLAALKGKRAGMTEEQFRDKVEKEKNMSKDAIKKLIALIKEKESNFFS